jgi:hypothetical protein
MGDVRYTSAEEVERHLGDKIDHQRGELEKHIAGALAELNAAMGALGQLNGELYDVEFAEGCGVDVAHHLYTAARTLRAADALRFRAVAP